MNFEACTFADAPYHILFRSLPCIKSGYRVKGSSRTAQRNYLSYDDDRLNSPLTLFLAHASTETRGLRTYDDRRESWYE